MKKLLILILGLFLCTAVFSQTKYLIKGGGTRTLSQLRTDIGNATSSQVGLMSASYFAFLDSARNGLILDSISYYRLTGVTYDSAYVKVYPYGGGAPDSLFMFLVGKLGGAGGALLAANNLADVTNITTARDNLGVEIGSDVQAYDSDLQAIAALTPTNDDIIQRKAGAWTNRTMAQLKTDLTLVKGDVGLGNVDNTSDATKNSATATLTNKRWTARVGSTTSSATPTINTDNYDIYKITALSTAITSMTSGLSGTLADGDILEIQITDNGTARAITWGSSFVSSTVPLPTTTVISTTLTVILQYYTTSSYGNNKLVCVNHY